MKTIFKTDDHVFIYPPSGTSAREAALVDVLSPGDRVLMFETGHFSPLWKKIADKLGVQAEFIQGDWRAGADPDQSEAYLAKDTAHEIKAVCVVRNETSTASVSPIASVRKVIDCANHPAIFIVGTISGLASLEYKHNGWNMDITVSG
jgi:alanine-glyoxylate transaminase/serine-glyoxylate transaminase/serine-pyruvate transaminase